MELHTQEILIQLNRIDKKMNKLQDDMKALKLTQQQLQTAESTQPPDSITSTRKKRQTNQPHDLTYQDAIELRPSRAILDQLASLNESSAFQHPKIQLSYYHTNFLVIDESFSPYKGIHLNNVSFKDSGSVLSLPFLLTDQPILDANFQSTLLRINQSAWCEDVHAYLITQDEMIQQVRSIQYQSQSSTSGPSIYMELEPITTSLYEFILLGSVHEVPIINIQCNTLALKKDAHVNTLSMLLLRALLYSKAKDYLLDNQNELTKNSEMIEVMKHVTRLEQSTSTINGLKVPDHSYQLTLHEMGFAINDLGDDVFALSLRQLFGNNWTYISGNKVDPLKVVHILSKQYASHRLTIPVEIVAPMSTKSRDVQAFGIIVTEVEMQQGQNVFYLTDPVSSVEFPSYKELLQKAQIFEPKYPHDFELITIKQENGTITKIHDKDLKHITGTEYGFTLPDNIKVTDMKLSGGFYTFPKGTITRFIDLFFLYPQMLPYSTSLEQKYDITMIINESIRSDGLEFGSYTGALTKETKHTGILTMVTLNVMEGLTMPALRLRIPYEKNEQQILAARYHRYHNDYAKDLKKITGESLDVFLRQTTLVEYGWSFYTYDGKPWDRDIEIKASFRGVKSVTVPIFTVPDGFITWTQQYDLEYQETVNIISTLIYRSSVHEMEIQEIKRTLSDIQTVVNHLVSAVNALETAFTNLTHQLERNSHVPWWKKVLQGLVMVAGLAGTIVFPFSLPIAIGLIAGSTAIQVGLMFADGDYLAGGVQLAGVLIGLGIGYYGFRKATSASYPVVNLEDAMVLPPDETIPGINTRNTDGLWIEVKPLNILNNKMEDVGKFMIKKTKGLLRTLMKFDNAPVHARVRSQTTKVINGRTTRTTIVTGVTDGMPYLSHVNPRPGTFEIFEVFEGEGFVNGWTKDNVPVGGGFEDLNKSLQGLLIEGVRTDAEFQTLMRSWERMANDERAIALNDAQDYIRLNQTMYTELPNTRVPITFDETLVRNVSNVFAKHTGIYELIGLSAPAGPNNCQTYSKEIRDFFAKGSLRQNKLNNTSFLNDLMDAFDSSTQFKHIYTPAFQKRPVIDRSVVPIPIA